jgi:hypothetical protein
MDTSKPVVCIRLAAESLSGLLSTPHHLVARDALTQLTSDLTARKKMSFQAVFRDNPVVIRSRR